MDTKSILLMNNGAFLERADVEMTRVIANLLDPNTPVKAKRKLTITLEFSIDADRQNILTDCTVKPTLAPMSPSRTVLYAENPENVVEMAPQIPGQMGIDGGMWKLHAREIVKGYLEERLEAEIDDGAVVVAL